MTGLAHGATDREVVVGIASELTGEVTYRWRLVGSDGHVVSGRVQLTLVAAAPGEGEAPTVTPAARDSADLSVSTVPRSNFVGPFSTPRWARWWLRVLAFISIVLLTGATATALYVWPDGTTATRLRAMTSAGVILMELTASLAARDPSR